MSGETPKLHEAIGAPAPTEAGEDDEQLDLWGEPETEAGRALLGARGRGRPAGAKNRRTLRQERAAAWLLSRYPDPAERLLALGSMNVADLAALLGCTMLEAAQEQRLSLIAVLPYVKQRQPLAIDVRSRSAIYLTIKEGAQLEAGGEGVEIAATIVDLEPIDDARANAAPADGALRDGGQDASDAP